MKAFKAAFSFRFHLFLVCEAESRIKRWPVYVDSAAVKLWALQTFLRTWCYPSQKPRAAAQILEINVKTSTFIIVYWSKTIYSLQYLYFLESVSAVICKYVPQYNGFTKNVLHQLMPKLRQVKDGLFLQLCAGTEMQVLRLVPANKLPSNNF